jgi:DNA-binding beta-propeller fold protein YncE
MEIAMRWILPPLVALVSCKADFDLMPDDNDTDSDGGFDTGDADADADADTDADTDDDGVSEEEDAFTALMPAQSDVYVFIANPDRGTVTRVQVLTKDVVTVDVGADPRVVLTTPDYESAVVFNHGDDTVTLIAASDMSTRTVEVRPNFNHMVMSPDGAYVALWHATWAERPTDPRPTGVVSYNEVSLVNVATGVHFPMVVGFNPTDIAFTPDGSLAVVVADAYLAKIDLLAPVPSPDLVRVADDLVDPPAAEEVLLAPAGDIAFVRQFGADSLAIVDLGTEVVTRAPIGDNPTDLDLSPDGDTAVVVSRGSNELYLFDVNHPFDPPEVLDLPTGATLGQLVFAPTGDQAVLYTTSTLSDRYATWDVATDEITLRSLPKPIAGMTVTPTGGSMLVLHTQADLPGASGPFVGAWAISLVDLRDFRPNTLRLPAAPTAFVNSDSGERGYLVLDARPTMTVLDYRTLIATEHRLGSEAMWVGVLPDLDDGDDDEPPAWVSQAHPLGRISFYDPDDDTVETLTGFELNAGIEE